MPPPNLDAKYLSILDLPVKTDAWRKFLDNVPQPEVVKEKRSDRLPDASTPAPARGSRPVGIISAAAGIAAIIVAAVTLTRHETPAAPTSAAPAVAQKTAMAPAATAATKGTEAAKISPAAAAAFDAIKIQGILYHAGHSIAIINGRSLDVGERINGLEVISIAPSNVVLACEGLQKTFKLK
jgi:hypothetical protein